MFKSCAARGDGCGGASVERGERYSINGLERPSGRIRQFGRNLRAYSGISYRARDSDCEPTSAFGVFSVCMKMFRVACKLGRLGCFNSGRRLGREPQVQGGVRVIREDVWRALKTTGVDFDDKVA